MGPHRRILLATDFSSPSREAFVTAVRRAREDGATLLLAHVVESRIADEERVADESREQLATWRAEAQAHGAREVQCLQLCGTPWREIVAAAREERADLVVVGVGAVAEKVVQHAPCAVLVARSPAGER